MAIYDIRGNELISGTGGGVDGITPEQYGAVGDGAEGAYELGVSGMFSINRRAEDFSVSKFKTKENFSAAMDAILGLLAAWEQR